jgi:hypothetical protein
MQMSSSERVETFLFTEEAVTCEKTAEQAVLKVEVKTEVEEDRNQLKHEVRYSFLILPFLILKH